MQIKYQFAKILLGLIFVVIGSYPKLAFANNNSIKFSQLKTNNCQTNRQEPNFLVFGGGGTKEQNEIAIEKNVLYFQRTLEKMGYNPLSASIFFANGNDGKATIRYIDKLGNQQFKAPEIPDVQGKATFTNLQNWFQKTAKETFPRPIFFYFTGHGIENPNNSNDNALMLWENQPITVQQLSQMLDKLPQDTPVVTMMAQCFSGSFANIIYQGGDPNKPVALQTRCGFFATIKTLPSVGCTPEVNEADYKDYSSSFFAGLSGYSRTGKRVTSADYNRDGKISYAEAHSFAKVDEETIDLPVSTSEVWLQNQATNADIELIWEQPIINLLSKARPEQQYVVKSIVKMFNLDFQKSYIENGLGGITKQEINNQIERAYFLRLGMELINIGVEQKIRSHSDKEAIAILERLIKCEAGSWEENYFLD
ncbi:MAG: Caspase domain-containing protein [Cyanobacteria bacterium P01_H01_bin.35]